MGEVKTKRHQPSARSLELERLAKEAGLSLPDYLQREYEREHPNPPIEEVIAEILSSPPIALKTSPADIIREMRGPLPGDEEEFARTGTCPTCGRSGPRPDADRH